MDNAYSKALAVVDGMPKIMDEGTIRIRISIKIRIFIFPQPFLFKLSMGKYTVNTLIPNCRLYCCFCLGWCSRFVDSESGQKQSVKLLQNMFYNTSQHPPHLPPQPHTVCIYCTMHLLGKRGRGGGGQREGRGATVYKRGRKYQHD